MIALATGLATRSLFYLPILSFAGALLALVIVYVIGTRRARTAATTMLLGGLALNALSGAARSFLITATLVRFEVSQRIIFLVDGRVGESHFGSCVDGNSRYLRESRARVCVRQGS